MYDKISQTEEEVGNGSNFLNPGLHEVYIESITVEQKETAKYSGQIAIITLKDANGHIVTKSVFPQSFNASFKDKEGNPSTKEAQEKEYMLKLKHLFNKACGDEKLNGATSTATDFASFMNLAASVVTKSSGADNFRVLVRADKNNFSEYPLWTRGCAEKLSDSGLRFDEERHGRKEKEQSAVEVPAVGAGLPASDDLPF